MRSTIAVVALASVAAAWGPPEGQSWGSETGSWGTATGTWGTDSAWSTATSWESTPTAAYNSWTSTPTTWTSSTWSTASPIYPAGNTTVATWGTTAPVTSATTTPECTEYVDGQPQCAASSTAPTGSPIASAATGAGAKAYSAGAAGVMAIFGLVAAL